MKKMMIVALMAAAASTAFAGDSDALKSILKAKTYAEAVSLVNANLGQLANSAEKAKAYNKLVDLALDKVSKEQGTITSNQMAQQMGTGKVEAFDTVGFYDAVLDAFKAANECEKYDQMPNEKGKVKPAFHNKNVQRLVGYRTRLIDGGIYFQNHDMKKAFAQLAEYVDSHDAPLFKDEVAKTPDENYANMAYYAARFAYLNQDMENVPKYADIAGKDEKLASDATVLKLAAIQQGLKTREDSVKYVSRLETDYAANPKNEMVLGTLLSMYGSLGMNTEMNSLIDKVLAADPENFTAWATRGQNAMFSEDWDLAISSLEKAIAKQPESAVALSMLGASLINKGAQAQEKVAGRGGQIPATAKDQILPFYNKAKEYLERAKAADPTEAQSKWSYALDRCEYLIDSLK